jgi:hypothetical protein
MMAQGSAAPQGAFQLSIVRGPQQASQVPSRELSIGEIIHYGFPARWQPPPVRAWKHRHARSFWRGLPRVLAAKVLDIPMLYSRLSFLVRRADGSVEDLLLVSVGRMVTQTGVNFIASKLAGTTPLTIADFKFHGIGTTNTPAEASGNTALTAEITTQYTPDNTRPTGTQSATTNVYTTVATITVDAGPVGAVEWGLFTQAATGGGTMLDRRVYAVVTLAVNDSLVPTYTLTLPPGG